MGVALLLKGQVTHREDLVYEQDVRIHVCGDGEPEPGHHSGGVALDRGVQERFDAREVDDRVELGLDLLGPHSEDRAVEEDVLAAGQVRVKPRSHFDQAAQLAAHSDASTIGTHDAREQLEQRALSGTVRTDDPERLARFHLERDVTQSPKIVLAQLAPCRVPAGELTGRGGDQIPETVVNLTSVKLLPDLRRDDSVSSHGNQTYSAKRNSRRWKRSAAAAVPANATTTT